jgi:hypothetical protein
MAWGSRECFGKTGSTAGEWNASTGSLNFPAMIACEWTGAFPIIPEFWNHAIIAVAVAKKPAAEIQI